MAENTVVSTIGDFFENLTNKVSGALDKRIDLDIAEIEARIARETRLIKTADAAALEQRQPTGDVVNGLGLSTNTLLLLLGGGGLLLFLFFTLKR